MDNGDPWASDGSDDSSADDSINVHSMAAEAVAAAKRRASRQDEDASHRALPPPVTSNVTPLGLAGLAPLAPHQRTAAPPAALVAAPTAPATALGIPSGARVEARYRGRSHWFRGVVRDRAAAGGGYTYSVEYDDGEVECGVSSDFVRVDPLAARSPAPALASRDEAYVSISRSPTGQLLMRAPLVVVEAPPRPPVAAARRVDPATGRLVVGAAVEANFAASGVWHGAVVTAVHVNERQWERAAKQNGAANAEDATTYDVRYADGYKSSSLAPSLLRTADKSTTAAEERFDPSAATTLRRAALAAPRDGAAGASSARASPSSTRAARRSLELHDDDAAHPLRRALQSSTIAITISSRVKVNFADCGQLYAGEVVWVHTDGSLDVRYEGPLFISVCVSCSFRVCSSLLSFLQCAM